MKVRWLIKVISVKSYNDGVNTQIVFNANY
jgi:hypothetical protein